MSVIQRKELVTDEAINWPVKYKKDLEEIIATSKKLSTNQPKVPGSDPKTRKNITELQKVQTQLARATEKSTGEFRKQQAQLARVNKLNREAVKDINAQSDAYDKLDRELISTRKAYKNLAAANKENTTEGKRLLAQTKKLDSQLKRIDNRVGQNQRSVGKYSNALKGVATRFIAWGAAIALVTRALKSGFDAVRDNSKANAELRGILNKTRKETIELRKEQLRLGGATVFTATQVTKAQTELSRLGLSMEEIISLTPAILDGAIALGVDMAEAAELVAGQLNAFNLAATDGKRVTDVLVRATQISAFNYIKLKDALRVVSPAAAAVGDSIEDVVSKLTAAVDANIDAGTASTALRNIYIELAKSGLSWDDAMIKINTSTNKLTTANDLFGKRGAVVALALAGNTEKINENKIALDEATGAAEAFAKAQKDNLVGDQLLWTSAWTGFFQQLNEGSSFISEFTRGTIQAFTAAMQGITRAMAGTDLETVLWEENLVKADLSLEALGKIANNSADEISRLKNIIKAAEEIKLTGSLIEISRALSKAEDATEELEGAEKRRIFILDLLKRKIKEINTLTEENTEIIEDNTEAEKEAEEAVKKAAQTRKDAIGSWLKLNNAINGTNEGLSQFGILTDEQEVLLDVTEGLFGKNTIDEDAKEFLSKTDKAIKDRAKKADEDRKEQLKQDQLLADAKAAIVDQSFELASESANRFTDLRIQQIAQELNVLEFARDRELEKFSGNKRKEEEINAKFNAKKKALLQKQANAEKANALFKIAINTAIAIASANTLIPPLNIPAIIFAAAIGAVQAAAVLAAPIPQFDKGIEGTPKDYIAGEKRPELRKSGGKWSLIKEPTMFKNSPGDTIVSGKETDSILGSMADLTGKNMLTNPGLMLGLMNNDFEKRKAETDLSYIIKKTGEDTVRAINKKKFLDVQVNTARSFVTEINGQTRIDHINEQYRS